MKKSIFLSLLFALILGTTITFSSCNGCSKTTSVDGIEQVDSLDSVAVDSLDSVAVDSLTVDTIAQ